MIEEPPLLTVARNPARLSPERIAYFADAITGWLADCMNGRGAMDAGIKPVAPERPDMSRFVGSALPCRCGPDDNMALVAAVQLAQPGDVIVAATDGFTGSGMLGDLVAGMGRTKGVVAIVTDGAVRDRAGLLAVGLPVYSRALTPNSCVRSGPGTVGLPVIAGGLPVAAGDLVVGDADGVVVVPAGRIDEVAKRLVEVRAAEQRAEIRVAGGATTLPDVEAILASDRVRWVD
ncbi:MAG: 4-hydroxy-4-methyl-2-oxoglutarate aldolase [Geminicoccaceae bacterium]